VSVFRRRVRGTPGVLSIAFATIKQGFKDMIVAEDNVGEAALVDGLNIYGQAHLGKWRDT